MRAEAYSARCQHYRASSGALANSQWLLVGATRVYSVTGDLHAPPQQPCGAHVRPQQEQCIMLPYCPQFCNIFRASASPRGQSQGTAVGRRRGPRHRVALVSRTVFPPSSPLLVILARWQPDVRIPIWTSAIRRPPGYPTTVFCWRHRVDIAACLPRPRPRQHPTPAIARASQGHRCQGATQSSAPQRTWHAGSLAQRRTARLPAALGALEAAHRARLMVPGIGALRLELAGHVPVDETREAQAGLPACHVWRQTQEDA